MFPSFSLDSHCDLVTKASQTNLYKLFKILLRVGKTRMLNFFEFWGFRECLDGECAHNNGGDRFGSFITGMGYGAVRLASWTGGDVALLHRDLFHFYSPCRLLPLRRPYLREEELHLYGCCPIKSR